FVSIPSSDQIHFMVFTNQNRSRQRSSIVMEHLRQGVSSAIQQGQHFIGLDVCRQLSIVRQSPFTFYVEIDVTRITEWSSYFVIAFVDLCSARRRNQMVVPLVIVH